MTNYYDWEIMISPDTEITFEIGAHECGKEFALMRFAERSVDTVEKLQAENVTLRTIVQRMWPAFSGMKRAAPSDKLCVRAEIDELGIEVD